MLFMITKDSTGCNKKNLLFDNQNVLDRKIDKLTAIMSKFNTKSKNHDKPFKPYISQGKRGGQRKD